METYDLVVVGSGPAGEKAAALAAYFGKRVVVVERDERPGGAPVNRGGIPTKTLREAALYLTGFRRRQIYGVGLGLTPEFLLERLRVWAAQVSATMAGVVRHNLQRHRVKLIQGHAWIGPDRTVTVTGVDGAQQTLAAEVVLVATGSRPFRPPGIPFDDPDVYDSDTLLELDAIPRSLVVIGGGSVGSEYASIFAALGVEVTVIDAADRLLGQMDREISALVYESFTALGIRILLGSPGARVERSDSSLRVSLNDGRVLRPHKVLFAAGRVGNIEGLGLEAVGVELDERGRVVVDKRFKTTVPWVYAAGDVIGPPPWRRSPPSRGGLPRAVRSTSRSTSPWTGFLPSGCMPFLRRPWWA
jgi:NAD(P) transhydrogenase